MEDSECDKKCRLEEDMVARRALSNGNAQWSREGRPESMNHFFFIRMCYWRREGLQEIGSNHVVMRIL